MAEHSEENERLRDALGVILAGLTDALGDPMGARPSQVTTLYSIASHAMRPIQSEGFPCPSCGHRLSAYDWCPACLAHQPPPSTEEAHDGR